MKQKLKIGTLNLQLGVSTTKGYSQYLTTFWNYALPHSIEEVDQKAADIVKKLDLDILTLTEAEPGSRRVRRENQVEKISELTDFTNALFLLYKKRNIGQCNGLCSKYPIQTAVNHKLPRGIGYMSLGAAELEVDDQYVTVMVTHLPVSRKDRKQPMKELVEIVNGTEGPVILTGDLNTEDQEELKPITEGTRLRTTDDYKTYPSWNPAIKLDHIFVSPEFEVDNVYVPDVRISDHLPLVAEVCLK